MKITFFSNFLLHHQTPFCEAMVKRIGDGFRFVAVQPIPSDRLEMGYKNLENAPYAVNAYKDEASRDEALRLGYESDVVIIGSAPDEYIEKRLAENKMTFRYSERFFKKFRWRFDPRTWILRYKRDIRYRKKNLYMLCASAYTARDCRFIFSYPDKTYKWGYFPEISEVSYDAVIKQKSDGKALRMIWVSRFIGLKHPEEVVMLAERLKKDSVDFSIEMLGVGELRSEYEQIVKEKGLDDVIGFSGPFDSSEVLRRMRKSDVFLFTSDKNEGWGAVLNEAMSSACAVVACREIGSVPYLIEHGKNGLIYDKTGKNSLYHNVRKLIDDNKLKEKLQKNAYKTITEVWNADVAADRLLHLIEKLQSGGDTDYPSGPCSKD